MTHLRIQDVRKMQTHERKKKLEDLRKELLDLRSQASMGGVLTNTAEIRNTKRSIARILTVMRELDEI